MLLKKQEENGVIEALFESSNIFKSIYLPSKKILYVFFGKGNVYSYFNIDPETYKLFEEAKSQGQFFIKEIKLKKELYPHSKEFKMKNFEINELTEQIGILINEKEEKS